MLSSLEARRLFSATVSEGYAGHYEVFGTSGADMIAITVSQSGESFSLDGATYTGVSYINVYGFDGDDTVRVHSPEGWGSIGASVSGDAGNDDLTLNFDGGIWGGAGADSIRLTDSFRGSAYGEGGNDRIYVNGDSVWADISGGDGDDYIDASGNYWGVFIDGGTGRDTIVGSPYDDTIYDDSTGSIDGNGGTDSISFY